MYDIEKYYNAVSVDEALQLMKDHPSARLIAGGSDVLIRIREGKMAGCELICIRDIQELHGIERKEDGSICIGAAESFSNIARNSLVRKYIPVLGNAVSQVGGPQVRNIGTIGGNLCNGAVSADSAPSVFCLEADMRIISSSSERIVPVDEFYAGPGKVNLLPGELVTHIIVRESHYKGYTGHYIKYSMRNAMDIATLGCCVLVKPSRSGREIEDIKITFGVAAPVPYRCKKTEESLRGQRIEADLERKIASGVRDEISPRDSWRASRAFRLQIGGEIAARALRKALEEGGISYE